MNTPVRRLVRGSRPNRPSRRRGGAVAAVAVASLTVSTLVAGIGGVAATESAGVVESRGPLVHRPIDADAVRKVRERKRVRKGVDIAARCGTPVVATTPGIAKVRHREAWGNKVAIKLVSSPGEVVTVVKLLRKPQVVHDQLIQAGQQLGQVPWNANADRCQVNYRVRAFGEARPVAAWLDAHAGEAHPSNELLGDPGFEIASFNVLGASHTARRGSRASWPDYDVRLPKALEMLSTYGADVVGLQELQKRQHDLLLAREGDTWGIFPPTTESDTENSIIWRKSRFDLLEGTTFPVPYFDGHIRQMPSLLLQDKLTGRTFHVANVHNPADTSRFPNQGKWRREAIQRERNHVISLRQSGRPVFLTGDFNAREAAFCPLTAGKLMISPESIPSLDCAMPRYYWVDWIFAAGQTRFTSLRVDTSPRERRISDHPLVIGRAHLQD